jgi:hypothetical protein
MTRIVEFYGHAVGGAEQDWPRIVQDNKCEYLDRSCTKKRKSDPSIVIGSCTVLHDKRAPKPMIICPERLTHQRKVFVGCIPLLSGHAPGNQLHLVPQVEIPGGSVDYFLVSTKNGAIQDFVGIELQSLDTTGTVWPERQRLLRQFNIPRPGGDDAENSSRGYSMNWKHTAKTTLMQIHHKVQTFEHVGKKLVLVLQDQLLAYMRGVFRFGHFQTPAGPGNSFHIHSYRLDQQQDGKYTLNMVESVGSNMDGIAECLALQADACMELSDIIQTLSPKISDRTRIDVP